MYIFYFLSRFHFILFHYIYLIYLWFEVSIPIYLKVNNHRYIIIYTYLYILFFIKISFQFSSLSRGWLCDPMDCSTLGRSVYHKLLEPTQTHVHWVDDAVQPLSSHPLSSPSPPALNHSQNQGLFKWVSSSHQVAKILEFQLQPHSFQWTPKNDLL